MNVKASAEAYAPASMGNVGVGFDILGLAFKEPEDVVQVIAREEPGAVMLSIEGDGGVLPLDASQNTASVAVDAFLKQIQARFGVGIKLYKNLPLASGLGSSAASAVAAVVAANALFGEPLPREALLSACMEGEALVSGYHADNVAPSLLGGILIVGGVPDLAIRELPVPSNLHFALVTPDIAVPTSEARALLPRSIPLKKMVAQTSMVARLIDALYREDIQAMGVAMEADGVIEPSRVHLIPHLQIVRVAAKRAGATGMVISGAGPTLCAVCDTQETAKAASEKMADVYREAEIGVISRYTQVNTQGACVSRVVD